MGTTDKSPHNLDEKRMIWGQPATRHGLTWILVITVGALLIRLYKLQAWGFWEDEIFTIREMGKPMTDLLAFRAQSHPLFPVLQKLLLPLMTWRDEDAYRLLGVIFGTLTVPILAVFSRSMFGKGAALITAIFLALSPWHIYWSQNCRYYTLVAMLAVLTCWLFWQGRQQKRGAWAILWTFVPAVLAAISHPSAALVMVALAAFMVRELIVNPGVKGRLARSRAVLFLLGTALGCLALIVPIQSAVESYGAAKAPNPVFHLANSLVYYIGVQILVVSVFSWWPLRRQNRDAADFLLVMIVVPIFCIGFAGIFVRASAQYLFYTLPFFLLLAGWGTWTCLTGWWDREKGVFPTRHLAVLPLAIIIACSLATNYLYFQHEHGWRPRWREAANCLKEKISDRDVVSVANSMPLSWYLNPTPTFGNDEQLPVIPLEKWSMEKEVEHLLTNTTAPAVWVVIHLPVFKEKDPSGVHLERLLHKFNLVKILPGWSGPRDTSLYILMRRNE